MQRKALIVKFGQIGDVIMAIPAVRALNEQGYEIEWLCGEAVATLLACYSWIRVIPSNDRGLLLGSATERLRALVGIWARVGFKYYDLCATLYYDRRYLAATLPVVARRRLSLSYSSRTTRLLPARHPADEWLRLITQLDDGCREQSAAPVRPDVLPSSPLRPRRASHRIAFAPGGAQHLIREQASGRLPDHTLRRWPIARYVELAKSLLQRGWEVILLGSAQDVWILPHFSGLSITDCVGCLSLPEVISACDDCDVLVTHDTGPLHLGGLSRASLVGVFGPTDPATRIPRRDHVLGIWGGHEFACRPCYDGREFAPCRSNGCMQQVTSECVLRELDKLLDHPSIESCGWRIVSV